MKYLTIIVFILISIMGLSQSTTTSTFPTVGAHLGWDDTGNSPLWINQNNQNRMVFNTQTTWSGLDGESETNVNRITIPQVGTPAETVPAWSMLHLWEGLDFMHIQS